MVGRRLKALYEFIQEQSLDGLIVTKPENRRYFSGFTGSSGMLLISVGSNRLFTDFRYIEQATKQAELYQIIRCGNDLLEVLGKSAAETGLKRIGFESDYVSWDTYRSLTDKLKVELAPVQLDSLRMVKDETELAFVRQAVQIADETFSHILPYIKPGVREQDISLELEYKMRRLGAEKSAFDIIVASGVRSALPHGVASDKLIEVGDFVTMDFGAVFQGYHSDITRTVVIGKANRKQREIYDIVLTAQMAGMQAVQPGKTGKDVDATARKIIEDAGYGAYFGHGLGHGVGLVIHESPKLSTGGDTILAPNMVVTVEPGVYLPEWGGVRIEDMVVVSAIGVETLTASSKELIELDW